MSHEIVKAYIFEGNEYIDRDDSVELTWTEEGILEWLCERFSDYECDVDCDDMFVGDEPMPIRNTLDQVSEGVFQCVADAHDGGMIYIVRIYD